MFSRISCGSVGCSPSYMLRSVWALYLGFIIWRDGTYISFSGLECLFGDKWFIGMTHRDSSRFVLPECWNGSSTYYSHSQGLFGNFTKTAVAMEAEPCISEISPCQATCARASKDGKHITRIRIPEEHFHTKLRYEINQTIPYTKKTQNGKETRNKKNKKWNKHDEKKAKTIYI